MNKRILTTALIAASFSFYTAQAQIAERKGITLEEVVKEVNTLAQKGDDESKAQIQKEANSLAKSKNELFAMMAPSLYNFIGNKAEADKVTANNAKRFPKGIQARKNAFEAFIGDETLSAAQLEKKYEDWLKKFPKSYFEKLNTGERDFGFSILSYYGQAAQQVAKKLIAAGEYDKALAYVAAESTVDPSAVARDLVAAKQYDKALPLAEAAYQKNKEAFDAAKANGPAMREEWVFQTSAALYASVLNEAGNTAKSVEIAQEIFDAGYDAPGNTAVLAKGLQKQGKDLDAFLVLHNAMVKSGRTGDKEALHQTIEPIYSKLNNSKGNFEQYTASLDNEIKEATLAKYKGEMIKKEAPNFSLVNMSGETVNLSDLKGKVVVLDFWATWCGPCKISFPGMQAAVNKYKDDKEVEFLFIDTWQREENYKEVVEEFITANNYSFHVLFDEMKDREKATTTAYGVRGIPHKVVIDKEGFIRFESSGGSADIEKIVNEMETKIELARKG